MCNDPEVFTIRSDDVLAEFLKKDFTSESCIGALLASVTKIAESVGVTISWEITATDSNQEVDKIKLTKGVSQLTTSMGAVLVGGKINVMSMISAQNRIRTSLGQDPKNVK